MESVFGTVFMRKRGQRRAATGCFGFTRLKGCCGGSSRTGFRKSLIYQLFAQ